MTQAQRDFYEANGYLVFPDALPPSKLTAVREAADRAEARWRADVSLPGQRGPGLWQVQAPIEYDPLFLQLLWHPVVFGSVREILGDDVQMIDNDYFITPPGTASTHADWHHDVGMNGVFHPRSTLMVKAFFLLSDVLPGSGGTALLPGSHRMEDDAALPHGDPNAAPNVVQMSGTAGTAYLFNGRIWHAAVPNTGSSPRRALIYNYGHFWMKMWDGYAPSERLRDEAKASGDPVRMQLLGLGDAYGQRLRAESRAS